MTCSLLGSPTLAHVPEDEHRPVHGSIPFSDRGAAAVDGDLLAVSGNQDRAVREPYNSSETQDLIDGALRGFASLFVLNREDAPQPPAQSHRAGPVG